MKGDQFISIGEAASAVVAGLKKPSRPDRPVDIALDLAMLASRARKIGLKWQADAIDNIIHTIEI